MAWLCRSTTERPGQGLPPPQVLVTPHRLCSVGLYPAPLFSFRSLCFGYLLLLSRSEEGGQRELRWEHPPGWWLMKGMEEREIAASGLKVSGFPVLW